MNQHLEVIRCLLPLLDTLGEALEHMEKQVESLNFEGALKMLVDFLGGVAGIEQAMIPMDHQLDLTKIRELAAQMKIPLNQGVNDLYQQDSVAFKSRLKELVYPSFVSWKEAITITLSPFVLS